MAGQAQPVRPVGEVALGGEELLHGTHPGDGGVGLPHRLGQALAHAVGHVGELGLDQGAPGAPGQLLVAPHRWSDESHIIAVPAAQAPGGQGRAQGRGVVQPVHNGRGVGAGDVNGAQLPAAGHPVAGVVLDGDAQGGGRGVLGQGVVGHGGPGAVEAVGALPGAHPHDDAVVGVQGGQADPLPLLQAGDGEQGGVLLVVHPVVEARQGRGVLLQVQGRADVVTQDVAVLPALEDGGGQGGRHQGDSDHGERPGHREPAPALARGAAHNAPAGLPPAPVGQPGGPQQARGQDGPGRGQGQGGVLGAPQHADQPQGRHRYQRPGLAAGSAQRSGDRGDRRQQPGQVGHDGGAHEGPCGRAQGEQVLPGLHGPGDQPLEGGEGGDQA